MTEHALSVRRLRFRNRIANPLAARGRVEAALAGGAGSSRLENEAILCVRRIGISLPRLDRLSNALETEASAAARPARGFVPANANAVCFADQAELLACLARDWWAHNKNTSWWWQVLFPKNDFGEVVRRAWLEDARPLPAALARLESAGLASQFLTTFSNVDLAALWRNIVNAFHLPVLDSAWSAPDVIAAEPAAMHRPWKTAPWSPWISLEPSLTIEAARVLVTAILLERAPAKVRSLTFAHEVRAWYQLRENRRVSELAFDQTFPLVERASPKGSDPHPAPAVLSSHLNLPLGAGRMERVGPANAEYTARQTASSPSLPQESSANARRRTDRARSLRLEKGAPTSSSIATTDEIVALPSAAVQDRIATEWGGALYIINVAIALGLYGDFTTPSQAGLALSLWDFLALLGHRMVGEAFAEDPLFSLFARLSGRSEEEPPGADFEPPTAEPLALWLDRICHHVRVRTAASLGLGDARDLRALVLNHHAKIETTSARMDAHFALATHPIELRMAGLDRDPGWVPAGGRSIYFYYD